MPDPETISVAIVDDHPVVLRGLEALIEAEPDMRVVATRTTARRRSVE